MTGHFRKPYKAARCRPVPKDISGWPPPKYPFCAASVEKREQAEVVRTNVPDARIEFLFNRILADFMARVRAVPIRLLIISIIWNDATLGGR